MLEHVKVCAAMAITWLALGTVQSGFGGPTPRGNSIKQIGLALHNYGEFGMGESETFASPLRDTTWRSSQPIEVTEEEFLWEFALSSCSHREPFGLISDEEWLFLEWLLFGD